MYLIIKNAHACAIHVQLALSVYTELDVLVNLVEVVQHVTYEINHFI